jgi:O-antigen ligase
VLPVLAAATLAAVWPLSAYAVNPVVYPALLAAGALAFVVVVRPAYGIAVGLALSPLTNFQLSVGGAFGKPFHVLIPALGFAVLAYGLLLGRGLRLREQSVLQVTVLAFAAVALASSLTALAPASAVTKLFLVLSAAALFFAVLQVCADRRSLLVVTCGAVAGLLIAALQGIEERYRGVSGAIGFVSGGQFVARVQGSFGHPNQYGGFLAFVIPVAAMLALTSTVPRAARILAGIATVFAVPALLFSYARGAILALAIATLVWFGFRRPRVALLAVLAAVLIGVFFTPAALRQRFNPQAGQQDVPLRADIWGSAVDIYSRHPALGVGLGNFSVAYAALPSTLANASQRRLLNQHGLIIPPNAQNLYLGVLAEEGILGLAALTLLGLVTARIVWLGLRIRDPAGRAVALGLGASLLTLAIHGMFEVMLFTELAFPLFALIAVTAGFVALDRAAPGEPAVGEA